MISLGHVPDTAAILNQTHRILRPEGRLIVFDADHVSTTYALPDARKGREIDFKLVSAISTHPAICRQMPQHLQRAGFEVSLCVAIAVNLIELPFPPTLSPCS
jgi:hypothetical protein